jgi:ABC-type taurine transport system ATPase subunit
MVFGHLGPGQSARPRAQCLGGLLSRTAARSCSTTADPGPGTDRGIVSSNTPVPLEEVEDNVAFG